MNELLLLLFCCCCFFFCAMPPVYSTLPRVCSRPVRVARGKKHQRSTQHAHLFQARFELFVAAWLFADAALFSDGSPALPTAAAPAIG